VWLEDLIARTGIGHGGALLFAGAVEVFEGGAHMRRYIIGAMLMGFGGMLAGCCPVGPGLRGLRFSRSPPGSRGWRSDQHPAHTQPKPTALQAPLSRA